MSPNDRAIALSLSRKRDAAMPKKAVNTASAALAASNPISAPRTEPMFKPLTEKEVAELQRLSDEVYRDKLTKNGRATETEALNEYTTGEHKFVNPMLYGILEASEAIKARCQRDIRLIDSAISKFQLPFDTTVYRVACAEYHAGWEAGDVKPVPAFLSTSVTQKSNADFSKWVTGRGGNPINLEIFVPKGTRSIYIGNNTDYPKHQDELLLGRNLSYRVIGRFGNNLRLEVLK
ncbi:MAG: ADP-ribosyltransferase [Chitinispirillia bacterium]|nr:ADP-ribosyltransferase [Chitinispirillia bacterium]MCL2269381.1 ADP-ribosyltransferase [Chitinispirillia bacterium]